MSDKDGSGAYDYGYHSTATANAPSTFVPSSATTLGLGSGNSSNSGSGGGPSGNLLGTPVSYLKSLGLNPSQSMGMAYGAGGQSSQSQSFIANPYHHVHLLPHLQMGASSSAPSYAGAGTGPWRPSSSSSSSASSSLLSMPGASMSPNSSSFSQNVHSGVGNAPGLFTYMSQGNVTGTSPSSYAATYGGPGYPTGGGPGAAAVAGTSAAKFQSGNLNLGAAMKGPSPQGLFASTGNVPGGIPMSPKNQSSRTASIPHHHAKMAAAAARSQYMAAATNASSSSLSLLSNMTNPPSTAPDSTGAMSVSSVSASAAAAAPSASLSATPSRLSESLATTTATPGLDDPAALSNSAESWTALDIGGMGIRNVSAKLFSFQFLTTLYLNHNAMTFLSPAISCLTNLTCLHLSSNRLKAIPAEFGKLTRLSELLLYDNLLSTLPFEFGSLYRLKNLGLDGNPWSDPIYSILQKEGSLAVVTFLREHGPLPPPPPERIWYTVDNDTPAADSFTIFDYNILCNNYVDPSHFGYVPSWALTWDYRKDLIMQEILNYSADLICLQEVELAQYDEFFVESLKDRYESVFVPKSRSRTMADWEKKVVDGCAIFYRADKFRLLETVKLEFSQLAMNSSRLAKSDSLYNRVMNRDNVGVIGRFELKESKSQIIVGNAHIHWDPAYKDVKLIQALLFVDQLEAVKSAHPQASVLLTGDFNSLPSSGVYEYLRDGLLPPAHADFCTYSYEPFTTEGSRHSLALKDAYESAPGSTAPYSACRTFTNHTATFEGVIDYLWYSTLSHGPCPGLVLSGILCLIPRDYYGKISGLPNAHIPSDHLPLMAEFKIPIARGSPLGSGNGPSLSLPPPTFSSAYHRSHTPATGQGHHSSSSSSNSNNSNSNNMNGYTKINN